MDNFITLQDYDAGTHREILDSLLRTESKSYDPNTIEICEDRAVAEMRGYLDNNYDCEAIFSAKGEDRHPLILMFALDIAIYHIFCIHNPYKMSKIRQDRYDRAVAWLKEVMKGDVTIAGAPLLPEDNMSNNSPWQIQADQIRPTFI